MVLLLLGEHARLAKPGPSQRVPHTPNTDPGGPDPPEEVAPGQALLSGLGAAHGEAQPLGHVRPSLDEAALLGLAGGGAVLLLQAPQGHRPVDGLEDDGSALLGDGPPVAHIAAHQAGDGVEALHLKLVLHSAVGLTEPQDRPADLEVLREVLPLAGQDKVSGAGQRITNQEVTVSLHEVF